MGKPAHAIVIGGSMAGLLAARVLSDRFEQVTLLERDDIHDQPESRKGQPQARHIHALLAGGTQVLRGFFPTLLADLAAEGALIGDQGDTMRWYCLGGYRATFTYGMPGVLMSRPLLEWVIRRDVAARRNVVLRGGCAVQGLEVSPDQSRVAGVQLAGEGMAERLTADLVIDASGRGSSSPRWLPAIGYAAPPESQVRVNVGYATRLYERAPDDPLGDRWIMITPDAPRERRCSVAFPIEGGRWIVTLSGWLGDHPPRDEAGFLAYARSLPSPEIDEVIGRCAPLSEIRTYTFPANLRRHYERLARFPEGYLVLGDALCSFNPIYGQGMTSAAMQAATLDTLLAERGGNLAGIGQAFFRRAAKVVDMPWQLAVGEDFRFPETHGPRPAGTMLIHRYVSLVHRASHHDVVVCRAFLDVMNLLKPPSSLLAPPILLRALRYGRRGAATQGAGSPAERLA